MAASRAAFAPSLDSGLLLRSVMRVVKMPPPLKNADGFVPRPKKHGARPLMLGGLSPIEYPSALTAWRFSRPDLQVSDRVT